jgi:hypothetical protein
MTGVILAVKTCRKCSTLFSGRACKVCIKAYNVANKEKRAANKAAWDAANAEKIKADGAAYYIANRTAQIAKATAYRLADPERAAATNAAWHATNKEKVATRVKAQRSADPEKYADMCKRWYEANPDKVRARSAANYAANREKSIEYSKAWQKRNPEKAKANAAKSYHNRDREKEKAMTAARHAANPEKYRERRKAWLVANPDSKRISHQNRKARKKAHGGKLSQGLIGKLLILQDGKCACCGKSLEAGYHLDHIMPLVLGGPHVDENMQLLTPRCNMVKGGRHPEEFKKSNELKIL